MNPAIDGAVQEDPRQLDHIAIDEPRQLDHGGRFIQADPRELEISRSAGSSLSIESQNPNPNESCPTLNPTPYLTRGLDPSDIPFIVSSWLLSTYEAEPNRFVPKDLFIPAQTTHIEACLARYSTVILCDPIVPTHIMSWAVYSIFAGQLILHFLYIRREYRKQGLARKLLAMIDPEYTRRSIITTQYFRRFKALRDKFALILDPYFCQRMENRG